MDLIASGAGAKENDKLAALLAAGAAPSTIGDLLKSGRGLTATCEVCLHSARLDLGDLAARYGATHACSAEALRPLLQCSVCKSTESVLGETPARRHGATRPRAVGRIPDYV